MKINKNTTFYFGIFLVFLIINVGNAIADQAQGVETQITNGERAQDPAVYGNTVAWSALEGDYNYVYIYNLSTSKISRVTNNDSYQYMPSVYGDKVVWMDGRNESGYSIYMYNLSTSQETRITTSGNAVNPDIYGDKIVWQGQAFHDGEWKSYFNIYMYNLSTSKETQITTNESSQEIPTIYENNIVYRDSRSGNLELYMYNLSTGKEIQINNNAEMPSKPDIYGNRIVWSDFRYGNINVYMYDLSTSTETQITANETNEGWPAIYGDRIVYQSFKGTNTTVYMYNLSTHKETQITKNESYPGSPVIYGDEIVYADGRNGFTDIYMFTFPGSEPTPVPPVANFSASPLSGKASLKVKFISKSTGSPNAWKWNFGDGSDMVFEQNPEHTYSTPGIYTVKHTAINAFGRDTAIKTNYIRVQAILPKAAFSASPTSGYAPLKVTFTDKSTGSPTSWKWSFGDGTYSTSKNPVHTFDKAGKYTVSLIVKNAAGSNTITQSGLIVVNVLKAPVAAFSAAPTSGKAPLKVQFTDKSTNSPTSWKWSFGDGTYSTQKNPAHTYSKAGKYTVALTAKNVKGSSTKTISRYIVASKK